ncbi:MAG: rod-binding protein [Pirellulaceae bacterium]
MHIASQTFAPTMPPQADGLQSKTELRETFDQFVGETMFGQMLKSMRKSLDKPAYFHGGRGEEVFQSQLDQLLVEEISEASASSISGPMFELFAGRLSGGNEASSAEIPATPEARSAEFESTGTQQTQPRLDLSI